MGSMMWTKKQVIQKDDLLLETKPFSPQSTTLLKLVITVQWKMKNCDQILVNYPKNSSFQLTYIQLYNRTCLGLVFSIFVHCNFSVFMKYNANIA